MGPRIFDHQHYALLNAARGDLLKEFLCSVIPETSMNTAVDVGCGLGHFSELLRSVGLQVTGIDGREENVQEAARRFTGIRFRTMNAEEPAIRSLGKFDLTLCFGLLYHLENPFAVVRNLEALTGQLLLVESVIYHGADPVMVLVDEESHEDQGLDYVAFYPTEACLIQMFFRSGFKHVYRFAKPPNHRDFKPGADRRRVRTMLAASRTSIESSFLVAVENRKSTIEPWNPNSRVLSMSDKSAARQFGLRLLRRRSG